MDLTKDIQLIQSCLSSDSATTCVAGCQWRHGKDATNPTVPSGPEQPLFTADFCHPMKVDKDTPETMWSACLAADVGTCATTMVSSTGIPSCVYSNGKDLIPDHDFCAPMDLTNDVQLIQTCVKADSATTCGTGCQWRHGKNADSTKPEPTPLFSEDFCHPFTVSKDTA